MKYALNGITELKLQPPAMLHYAQSLRIRSWVQQAVEELFASYSRVRDWTDEDFMLLGRSVPTLVRAFDALQYQYRRYAAVPPRMPEPDLLSSCLSSKHDTCKRVWTDGWCKKIARDILHPVTPLSLSKVVDLVIETPFPGMTDCCKNNLVTSLSELNAFQFDVHLREQVVEEICRLHGISGPDPTLST